MIILILFTAITTTLIGPACQQNEDIRDIGDDFLAKFHQTEYTMKFERMELVSFDKNYIEEFTIITYKYNRTRPVANFTLIFKNDVGNDLQVLSQSNKLFGNRYRVFPIRFQVNVCLVLKSNVAGLGSYAQDAFKCPIKKGVPCRLINFYPDDTRLPPLIPSGEFRNDFTFICFGKEVAVFSMFVKIFRPIVIPD